MATTKNLELTEAQAIALDAALVTESRRLAGDLRIADRYAKHAEGGEDLVATMTRSLKANEYLRGRVAGLLAQF